MKKLFSCILTTVLVFVLALGCTACKSQEENSSKEKPGTVIEETDKSITIVDQAYREVTVPKNVKTSAFCYRVIARFILSLDKGDTIKGMGKTEDFLKLVQPSLAKAKDVGQGIVDIEALAELSPDIFIHKANDTETLNAVQELGIPAIGVAVETPEEMMVALDIMGKAFGARDKSKELIKYYEKKLEADKILTFTINEKNKKRALVMGSSIGKVADANMLQGFMIKEAGGINSAEGLDTSETWPTVGTEQIFEWNPEYIFISGSESTDYTAKDILNDKTWAEVEAVKKGRVYEMPATEDSWEFPGVVSVLGIDYMMSKMYPELISEEQLNKNIDEFYKLSYGRTFTNKQLGY